MKKLQNNYTTPEQSKRLLELGVPADSADCYVLKMEQLAGMDTWSEYYVRWDGEDDDFVEMKKEGLAFLPIWSVGRLMEIFLTCAEPDNIYDVSDIYFTAVQANNLMEKIIYEFEHSICIYSKLEE